MARTTLNVTDHTKAGQQEFTTGNTQLTGGSGLISGRGALGICCQGSDPIRGRGAISGRGARPLIVSPLCGTCGRGLLG